MFLKRWQYLVSAFALVLSFGLANAAMADMSLDGERSSLAFTSTKNGAITEVHQFTDLTGSITKAGNAEVTIDLISVATGIDIRDERMRKLLFNTDQFGKATFTANVAELLKSVKESKSQIATLAGELSLHGKSQPLSVEVLVTRGKKSWVVSTVKPVVINAADYDLSGGVEKLREIAKLKTISPMVPVTFVLTFTR